MDHIQQYVLDNNHKADGLPYQAKPSGKHKNKNKRKQTKNKKTQSNKNIVHSPFHEVKS